MTSSQGNSPFLGYCDGIHKEILIGWAVNRLDPYQPVRLHVLIDGQEIAQILADQSRSDVQTALKTPHDRLGFSFTIPVRFMDGVAHELSIRLPDRTILPIAEQNGENARTSQSFKIDARPEYTSCVDGVKQGALKGWVLQKMPGESEWRGDCIVSVTANGVLVAQVRADRYRGDVAAAVGCNPNCGFDIPIPQRFRGSSPRSFSVKILPESEELMGSPFTTSIADDALETRLLDIAETIDKLHRELTKLRTEIRNAIPRAGYNLGNYDRWALLYYTALRERTALLRVKAPLGTEPLVSILCPTYKPLKADYVTAIESVLRQTWHNWELILIDDGLVCPQTTALMQEYAARDARIRVLPLEKNLGISGATNAGMDAATGLYTVFFDHDDMLVDVAIETMMRKALETNALLLYSDEDKVDQANNWQSPNFKPDFNYRYLLGCNYVCHLTMVETETMRKIGPLRAEYDGAQDHDFILRACEIIPHDRIGHVAELLYHWRMTPNSTAVTVGNKNYAIAAGVKAVSDHLDRCGYEAAVSSINGLTLYRVDWRLSASPKVSIIIPFKDQIDITQRCIETLLERTAYDNYEIVLIDNWSVTPEAHAFMERFGAHEKLRFLTIEEPFNYSRLNNLAAHGCSADFLLFLNNDVFVEEKNWLRLMVNEALADPQVGAVGARLLYPNQTIQHASVVVGPAGVGAHAHRGCGPEDYGYIGRILLSHEVTAVTAACMLVRREVFESVGGFDEIELKIAYNDVDLCLRIRDAGHRIIYCAEAVAWHHESLTRGSDDVPEHEARFFQEGQIMQKRWAGHPLFERDPAYPRFFTVDLQPFFDLVDPTRS
ncbi:O-antigen biosynthesis protein [Asaia sp. W19]|uniref:glycosyltransferase family 2 protein n=1 Tax=Asaia sp. W19 TaxID=2067395 RepID=UPI000F8DA612|nr:glycosyltransferase family 2 protein [Asaia sp. W19]RUT27216.1 O-antigen biosynthesis protein [Asaia sp. W19]